MKLTEGKIREAQEIIEQVMADCQYSSIEFNSTRVMTTADDSVTAGADLSIIYIYRLHKLNGTQAPPF